MSRIIALCALGAALLFTAGPASGGLSPDLSITKTDGQTYYAAGRGLTYTIVVTNTSTTASVTGAAVSDTVPAALTGVTWSCAASAGSACTASGSGNLSDLVNLLPGGTASYTLSGAVSAGTTGVLTNTATVTLLGDPNSANDSATDTDLPGADLAVTKTDGQAYYIPGQTLTYTIEVTNNFGPETAAGAVLTDTLPGTLTGASWTCTASAGSTCSASGSGDIADTLDIASGGTATYTLTATVSTSATGPLVNAATVTATVDPATTNNTGIDSDPALSELAVRFFAIEPCRVMDTRGNGAPLQGPALAAGPGREVTLPPGCGIPTSAASVSLNVTVISPTTSGVVQLQPAGVPQQTTATLNFVAGQTRGNNLVVGLSPSGQIRITLSGGTAHFVIDVNGYNAAP